jgi:PST family polysaccharide transporter
MHSPLNRALDKWRGSPLARATLTSWLASASIIVLGVVRTKVSAVTLGSTGVGIIGQGNYLSTFIGGIAAVGLSTACISAIAAARARGDESELKAAAHLAALLPLALGLLLSAVVIAFSPQVARSMMADSMLWWIVVLAALSTPLNLVVGAVSIVLQGKEEITRSAKASVIAALINTAVVVSLVLALRLQGAAIAILLTSLVSVGVSIVVAPRAFVEAFGRPIRFPRRAILATMVKLSLASLVLGAAGSTADLLIRTRVVGLFGVDSLGKYQPVFAISNQYLVVFISAIGVYMFPTLTRLLKSGDRVNALKELDAGLRLMLFVFTPLIILLMLAAPVVVRALYSNQFIEAVPVLRLQLIGDILKVCAYSIGAALLPLGLTRWWVGIGLGTVLAYLGVALILLPVMHLPALALAYVISWVLNLGVTLIVILRENGSWLSARNALLGSAAILSVIGMAALAAFIPGVTSIIIGIAAVAAWAWRALRAISSWLKAGREA